MDINSVILTDTDNNDQEYVHTTEGENRDDQSVGGVSTPPLRVQGRAL